MNTRLERLVYTLRHKVAIVSLERRLLGKTSIRILLHDMDKVVMLLIGLKFDWVKKLHRKIAAHHQVSPTSSHAVVQEAVLDWECARFTKPDKPLNARETCKARYPHLQPVILPVCDELGI